MKKRAFGAIAVVLGGVSALTWTVPARAQAGTEAWVKDKRIGEGAGYTAGDFEIHPGIAGEIGWDSNYLGRSDKTGPTIANANPVDTGEIRITPSLSLRTAPVSERSSDGAPAPLPAVGFALGASGTYMEFLNSAPVSNSANGNTSTLQSQRNMSAAANAALSILPGREWSGSVAVSYTRAIQPTVAGFPDASYNNDTISANADLAVMPNLGTLDWHFGYTFTGTFFEQAAGQGYNNTFHTGYTRGRWRFRPRTALLYDGQVSFRSYDDTANADFLLHQSTPVRARIGLEGLVTSRFSIQAMVGYGATLTNPINSTDQTVRQYDSVIGNLELRFFVGGQPQVAPGAKPSLLVSTIALGYTRDFQASYLDDFYGLDRGYLKAEYFFAGKFLVTLQGGVGAYEHPDLFFGTGNGGTVANPSLMASSFTDVAADASLFVEYRVLPSLGINATGTYYENFSSTQLPVTIMDKDLGSAGQVYDLNVRRITAFLGVRWFM
jgi:hypothetical protein